jgi:predicted NUDIX family NTP pyrophosphohydrolase
MPKRSAGLLVYRLRERALEVFLVHPGGPFWTKRDDGAWSIPKGEYTPDEDRLDAAKREFKEETGFEVHGEFAPLGSVKQAGGKIVDAWSIEADVDPAKLVSNTFLLEWPPRSGASVEFPEVDRADWFPIDLARRKILPGQLPLLDSLVKAISTGG